MFAGIASTSDNAVSVGAGQLHCMTVVCLDTYVLIGSAISEIRLLIGRKSFFFLHTRWFPIVVTSLNLWRQKIKVLA